jgi:TPR repeat protein
VKPNLLAVSALSVAMAVLVLATRAESGQPAPQDVERLRQAAERGDVAAQYSLGILYFRGDVVTQDYVQAAQWYRKGR